MNGREQRQAAKLLSLRRERRRVLQHLRELRRRERELTDKIDREMREQLSSAREEPEASS